MPDSFEIVALAPGEDAGLEQSVRPLLREQDRWIVAPGRDEYELFNLGAKEGAGEFVFVTEAHCVPEPDCIAAMLEELDRTGAPGIRGTAVPEAQGGLGVLERDAFQDALRNRIVPASIEDEAIEFEIPAGEHWISIGCEPFRPRRHGVDDPRALGVPVRGLSFEAR